MHLNLFSLPLCRRNHICQVTSSGWSRPNSSLKMCATCKLNLCSRQIPLDSFVFILCPWHTTHMTHMTHMTQIVVIFFKQHRTELPLFLPRTGPLATQPSLGSFGSATTDFHSRNSDTVRCHSAKLQLFSYSNNFYKRNLLFYDSNRSNFDAKHQQLVKSWKFLAQTNQHLSNRVKNEKKLVLASACLMSSAMDSCFWCSKNKWKWQTNKQVRASRQKKARSEAKWLKWHEAKVHVLELRILLLCCSQFIPGFTADSRQGQRWCQALQHVFVCGALPEGPQLFNLHVCLCQRLLARLTERIEKTNFDIKTSSNHQKHHNSLTSPSQDSGFLFDFVSARPSLPSRQLLLRSLQLRVKGQNLSVTEIRGNFSDFTSTYFINK